MRISYLLLCAWLICAGCSRSPHDKPAPLSTSGIESNHFAILETELSPAVLIHSQSKYLGFFGDTNVPLHIAISGRSGPRPFRRGEKLKAAEMEECWLLLWGPETPPLAVFLQHRPLALSLDTNGLRFSFATGAGDVVLLPLHGSSTNVNTKKWSEFLTREPLLRIRYWAGALREFPFECETTLMASNTVRQRFRYHSIRDDWDTKPLQLAPVPPPLAVMADEQLKRKLMDLEMPTSFGAYMAMERVSEWTAAFPGARLQTNCAWANLGECNVEAPNTSLLNTGVSNRLRIDHFGVISASRDAPGEEGPGVGTLMNPSTRTITFSREQSP